MTTKYSREIFLKEVGPWKAMCEKKGIYIQMPADRDQRWTIIRILEKKDPSYFSRFESISLKELKALPIELLQIHERTCRRLLVSGIKTVADLLRPGAVSRMCYIRGFGRYSWADIRTSLLFMEIVELEGE